MNATPIPGCCLELHQLRLAIHTGDGHTYSRRVSQWAITCWLSPDERWPRAWRTAGHRPGRLALIARLPIKSFARAALRSHAAAIRRGATPTAIAHLNHD